jgi:hypothetical protein
VAENELVSANPTTSATSVTERSRNSALSRADCPFRHPEVPARAQLGCIWLRHAGYQLEGMPLRPTQATHELFYCHVNCIT